MNKNAKVLLTIAGGIVGISAAVGTGAFIQERIEENKYKECKPLRPDAGTYERYVKRPLDASLATGALLCFSPILAVTAALVKRKLGSPVIFTQVRPGRINPETGKEKFFKLYKFRSMTDEKDENGKFFPDEVRLTDFGKKLRSTSLDELPELINIIKGDMAVIGPRPQLVRDMVFMSEEQRQRHTVRPGLSGLAQVMGRNAIVWEEKLNWDLRYLKDISFLNDTKLVMKTIIKTGKAKDITDGENVTALDFGDALLKENKISWERYKTGQAEARGLLEEA